MKTKKANPDLILTTVSYPIKGTEYYHYMEEQNAIVSNLSWEKSSDRHFRIKGRHSKRYQVSIHHPTDQLLLRWLGILRCPQCGGEFDIVHNGKPRFLCCRQCTGQYEIADGIPRLLVADHKEEIENFCAQYDALRLQEGWASEVPEFYLHLPFCDLSGRHPKEWQWRYKNW